MDIPKAQQVFGDRITELRELCKTGGPWIFLCTAVFLEYLAKLVDGKDGKQTGYMSFVSVWLARARPGYSSFKYRNGSTDLPLQMYYVLRCGIVHSFSLIPGTREKVKGGRERSIVLCHRAEAQQAGVTHLSNYSSGRVSDAALFVAEDFLDDIATVVSEIFSTAAHDRTLESNMNAWLTQHPLVTGGF